MRITILYHYHAADDDSCCRDEVNVSADIVARAESDHEDARRARILEKVARDNLPGHLALDELGDYCERSRVLDVWCIDESEA